MSKPAFCAATLTSLLKPLRSGPETISQNVTLRRTRLTALIHSFDTGDPMLIVAFISILADSIGPLFASTTLIESGSKYASVPVCKGTCTLSDRISCRIFGLTDVLVVLSVWTASPKSPVPTGQ